ncbi:MAG: AAA family ATPase [Armatimonadetes bacterium]|nr:AAA family ATPase [Armatimonadota bacterium]
MNPLADFLNHGILPFHGRAPQVATIVQFWRGVLHSNQLRCLLVEGEAGVGKSRLLQEAIQQIELQNGAVVALKLYPESTGAIVPLVAQSLWRDSRLHRLLRGVVPETLAGCADSLRRIARLRPTMLVMEDIHLLSGAALRECAQLVNAIADEPIALCATARPMEYPARSILAEQPFQELPLQGFDNAQIGAIWQTLFGNLPAPQTLAVVAAETLGNPLAIRAALQGAAKTGAMEQLSNGVWEVGPEFQQSVRRNAQAVSDGLTAQLTPEERAAAEQLSSLGEVFSAEAAELVVCPQVVRSLAFRGVLHQLPTPKRPLPGLGRSGAMPYAFTHSLVHRGLLAAGQFPVGAVLGMLSGSVPLYSILPFRLLLDPPDSSNLNELLRAFPLDQLRRAIATALRVAVELDVTADWPFALTVWQVATLLLETNADRFDADEARQHRANALARKLTLLRRELGGIRHQEALQGLLDLTQEPLPDTLAIFRIIAIAQMSWIHSDNPAESERLLNEALVLGARFPSLRSERLYSICLRDFCQIAIEQHNHHTARRIEAEYHQIQSDSRVPESTRRSALVNIAPYLLMLFDSPSELSSRINLCHKIAAAATDFERTVLDSITPYFYWEIGEIEQMMEVLEQTMEGFKARGMMRTYQNRRLLLAKAKTVLGENSLPGLMEWFAGHRADCAAQQLFDLSDPATTEAELLPVGLLLGRGDLFSGKQCSPEIILQLPLCFKLMIGLEQPAADHASNELALLSKQVMRLEDVVRFRAAIMAARGGGQGEIGPLKRPLAPAVHAEAAAAFRKLLDWLAARRLDALLLLLLRDYPALLSVRQLAAYRKQAEAIATERSNGAEPHGAPDGEPDHRLVITMLGKIEVRPVATSDSGTVQPRGARQKSLLGTMVANELVGGRLERDEFLEAAGIEVDHNDPKLARDAVNSAIYRLRDLVGQDGILTDRAIPRLNLAVLRVDLIEATTLLREAVQALRQGRPARARDAAIRALDLTCGEVPFPTLYERLFEELRDDLENRLRLVVLRAGALALREGDAEEAESLVGRAWRMLPGDDEIGELYCRALEALDRRADAERVRKQMEALQ